MPNLRNSGDLQISYFQEQGAPVPAAPPAPPPPPQEDLRVDFLEAAAEKHVAEMAELQRKVDSLLALVQSKDDVTPSEVVAIAETVAQSASEAKDQAEIEGDTYDVEYTQFDPSDGITENDHSFHWDESTLTISAGNWTQEGGGGDYAAVTMPAMPLGAVPTSTRYYLKITWSSTVISTVTSVELTNAGTTLTNSEYIWYIDVMEFDGDGVCIERKQDDLVLPQIKETEVPRGTKTLFDAIIARAYLIADDTIVDPAVAYNSGTMYLYPTWDYIRVMA